ncbi:MAG: hypothetical protein BJ554DRAFT_7804 [Olpidium bornovanus]|uniref:Uncharacterized protein n=1 Tax=Olpidium bornovanus TaxID=278681 RepID=A0A8H7ZVP1_9FUNG|nr:MAG: hypothetical protein BJ554DRAFT_7804 [Olpidium bornovanus]
MTSDMATATVAGTATVTTVVTLTDTVSGNCRRRRTRRKTLSGFLVSSTITLFPGSRSRQPRMDHTT